MIDQDIQQRLDWALAGSRDAAELVLNYYQRADLQIETKADNTPVTLADQGAEQLLREQIARHFPRDGILGGEFGSTEGTSGFHWILDPIDGTKSFVHGTPLFGMLIGLLHQGRAVAGVCRFPALEEVVYAQRGQGAWWTRKGESPQPARVSKTSALDQATFCFTSVNGWMSVQQLPLFEQLVRSTRMSRGWGDCYGHMLVATGRADLMIDPLLSTWDAAALLPIIQEAGGVFMDWTGACTIDGGNGISTTPELRQAVLDMLPG